MRAPARARHETRLECGMPIHAAHAPRRASRLSAAPMPPGSAFVAFEVRFVWHFPQAVPASLGPWAVFASVLVTQLGMPVPAVPMLIVGGTMAAMGQASYASMLVAAVAATVLADSMWFFAGRARGRRLLNALVRFLAVARHDAAHRAQGARKARRAAARAREVPAGPGARVRAAARHDGRRRVGVPVLGRGGRVALGERVAFGGAALHDEIVRLMQWVSASGGTLFDAFAAIFVTFLLYRWAMRMRFRRWLAKIRISPQQLDAMLKSAAPPIVFDARPRAVREKEAYRSRARIRSISIRRIRCIPI